MFLHTETLHNTLMACMILYNMIIEYEQNDNETEEVEYKQLVESTNEQVSLGPTTEFSKFI